MGFARKGREHGGQDSMWTSYSDLFLGLSIVFLLLYVTASLKQGTDGIRQNLENKQLVKEVEDLKQQLRVYETLKKEYLNKEATQDEQASYQELMDKLNLLQDDAKEEKVKLLNQANENDKKAAALNKYQQLIRNIINTNMIAKSRIKNRDVMIEDQDVQITDLEQSVKQKTQAIQEREGQVQDLEDKLDKNMKALKNAYIAHRITKQKYEAQQTSIQQAADSKINGLLAANEKAEQELDQANEQLQNTSTQLSQAQGKVAKLGAEKGKLENELAQSDAVRAAEVDKVKGQYAAQQKKDRDAFDAAMANEKLAGAARDAREAKFKADAAKKARDMESALNDLDKKYKNSQGALAKANENLNAKKNLARQIKDNFGKAGVSAEVDPNSGDVLLSFGDQYFDTGQATLKPRMREILEQAVPAYSMSLFDNAKVAKKIQSIEIVGFASPTYKGKYVDPASLDPANRQAVNYNLDLSYARARSIFNYVFDKEKMTFKHQETMLPLVKVSGRSFLANDKRDLANQKGSGEEFCRHNDCAKLQRVIIKFTLKD